MAVGDLNRDSLAEVVVSSVYGAQLGSNDVDLWLFQVAPDLGTIAQKAYLDDTEYVGSLGYPFGHIGIAVGAFDGKSVRVGPPTYSHMDDTLQLVAVINAPPKHEDEIERCGLRRQRHQSLSSTTVYLRQLRDGGEDQHLHVGGDQSRLVRLGGRKAEVWASCGGQYEGLVW